MKYIVWAYLGFMTAINIGDTVLIFLIIHAIEKQGRI